MLILKLTRLVVDRDKPRIQICNNQLWNGYDSGLPTGPSHYHTSKASLIMFHLNMVDYPVFFPSLSPLTWDTFLTLRCTQGFYLNHALPLRTSIRFSDSPEAKFFFPFFGFDLDFGLGLGLGLVNNRYVKSICCDVNQQISNMEN